MNSKGENLTISIGTLNVRGFRTKNKRKAIMRQAKQHCDVLLIQDSHLDGSTMKEVTKEWSGDWRFNNRATNSGGVAIFVNNSKRKCFQLTDKEYFTDNNGSILGTTIKAHDKEIYLICAYAPCLGSSNTRQTQNLNFLKDIERIAMEKKAKGLEVMVGGDLNFIRDSFLDADGGEKTVYKKQTDWLSHLEDDCNMIDSFRFLRPDERMFTWSPSGPNRNQLFRRLDYILCSKPLLS